MIIKRTSFESPPALARWEGTFSDCPLSSGVGGGPFLGGTQQRQTWADDHISPSSYQRKCVVVFGGELWRWGLGLKHRLQGPADELLQYELLCSCDPRQMQEKAPPLASTTTCNPFTLARRYHGGWNRPISHMKAEIPGSQNSLSNKISWGSSLKQTPVTLPISHSASGCKGSILTGPLAQLLSCHSFTKWLAINTRPGYRLGRFW